jgi:uncharacterized membrane protein YjfL (UPF0719 family)
MGHEIVDMLIWGGVGFASTFACSLLGMNMLLNDVKSRIPVPKKVEGKMVFASIAIGIIGGVGAAIIRAAI